MKPIINPIWFYVADQVGAIRLTALILFIGALIAGFVVFVITYGCDGMFEELYSPHYPEGSIYYDKSWPEKEKALKAQQAIWGARIKKLFILAFISWCCYCFIPGRKTCYKIIVSSYVTTNNVNAAEEQIKDIVDYIVDAVSEIKDGKEVKSDETDN